VTAKARVALVKGLLIASAIRHGDVNMASVWECSRTDIYERMENASKCVSTHVSFLHGANN